MIGTYASIVVNGVPPASAVDPRGNEMKLYNSIGPNPKVVRMFMAEKGIELSKTEIDIRAGRPINPDLANIGGWYARMKARPSAVA